METDNTSYVIYDNLEVRNLKSSQQLLDRDILYFIKTKFSSHSSSKHSKYYKHELYNSELTRIESNELNYFGVTCRLGEYEGWSIYSGTTCDVCITVFFTDRHGEEKKLHIQNKGLIGNGIIKMLKCLSALSSFHTLKDSAKQFNEITNPK